VVSFEIDCGWMIIAGPDPVRYMQKYAHRFRMLHIKDFVKSSDKKIYTASGEKPQGTELGHGFIDYRPIFAPAGKHGIEHYFVEQEPPFPEGITPLQASAMDYQYLHAL
jgi:sugar phosphate isomerase/epimerase